jgi:hypothetical protein
VQHFQRYPLLRSQMYFHVDELDPHREQNQASSMITGIYLITSCLTQSFPCVEQMHQELLRFFLVLN